MVNWYFKRLAAMSVREIPYRLWQVVRGKYEEYFYARRNLRVLKIPRTAGIFEIQLSQETILPSEINIFGKILDYSKDEINWHCDIFSGESFPSVYSRKIDIRNKPGLSAKNVWEINRLQFLTDISLNFHQTGNLEYLNQFIRIMNSWIKDNPYMIGINWYSNIEVNIRLINWFFCWEILDAERLAENSPEFEKFVREKWIPLIYQHCEYSYRNPSGFSSANNHLIAEYSGLFIAASKWKFSESASWLKYAAEGLEREIVRQHSDGINKEEAAEYIQFITDFFLLPFVIAGKTNFHFSDTYSKTLKEIFDYIFEIIDIRGNYPGYGDGDDGKVVSLSAERDFNNFISQLTSASLLFNDNRYKLKITRYDLKNEILFGEKGRETFDSFPVNMENRRSVFHKNEGHHIFRNQLDGKEIFLHFNAAPLGYLSMAAHGHADALSITMNINGYPIIVDPGTYSYHISRKWRDYFVSTMAHSTICIDGISQADHTGDTMWSDHYGCKLIWVNSLGDTESVSAEHNGYKKTRHLREVRFNKSKAAFTIIDEVIISDDTEHECILLFHLHPDIKAERVASNKFSLLHPTGIRVSVSIQDFRDCSIVNGLENPVLGWYSGSFMQKIPTNVLYAKRTDKQSFKSVTKILINEY